MEQQPVGTVGTGEVSCFCSWPEGDCHHSSVIFISYPQTSCLPKFGSLAPAPVGS